MKLETLASQKVQTYCSRMANIVYYCSFPHSSSLSSDSFSNSSEIGIALFARDIFLVIYFHPEENRETQWENSDVNSMWIYHAKNRQV